jgi:hypothetical protein
MQASEKDPDTTPVRPRQAGPVLQPWMIGLFGVVIVLLLLSLLVV